MAFSTLIVGIIGVILILVGGRDILAGRMTLGDLFMYMIFTGLVAMPIIDIANIGTQITEAFAGLDRIREIKRMATEDADDATRVPVAAITGDVEFKNVSFEYADDTPVSEERFIPLARGINYGSWSVQVVPENRR